MQHVTGFLCLCRVRSLPQSDRVSPAPTYRFRSPEGSHGGVLGFSHPRRVASGAKERSHCGSTAALHTPLRGTVDHPRSSGRPGDERALPNLSVSYDVFTTAPLTAVRGPRFRAWRNLMVSGINAGLHHGLFGSARTRTTGSPPPTATPTGRMGAWFASPSKTAHRRSRHFARSVATNWLSAWSSTRQAWTWIRSITAASPMGMRSLIVG